MSFITLLALYPICCRIIVFLKLQFCTKSVFSVYHFAHYPLWGQLVPMNIESGGLDFHVKINL